MGNIRVVEMNFAPASDTVSTGVPVTCETCRAPSCGLRTHIQHAGRVRRIALSRGDRLECNSGSCMRFWMIVSGTAATCVSFRDGRRQIASIETAGTTVCGPMASYRSEHWLEALEDAEVCEVDFTAHAAELRHDPGFLSGMFGMIHTRLEDALVLVSMLGRLDSQERVTLFLAERAVNAGGAGRVVTLPMSREDIADYLGLNTETVSRVFTRIRKSGLIRFLSPTEYLIPDLGAVAARLPVAIPGHEEAQAP